MSCWVNTYSLDLTTTDAGRVIIGREEFGTIYNGSLMLYNYAKWSVSNNLSYYTDDYSKSLKSANKHVENASNPDLVSKLIYKIINTKNPKIHYKVGQFIQKFSIVLKNILSDRLYEKILLYYSKN